MPVTGEELRASLANPVVDALDAEGLGLAYLIKKLKRELDAKATKLQKIKGKIPLNDNGKPQLAKGTRIVTQSEKPSLDKEGELYDDGETVIAVDEIDWSTRQRARMDAHKLRGDYAPDKVEHTGNDKINHDVDSGLIDEIRAFMRGEQ